VKSGVREQQRASLMTGLAPFVAALTLLGTSTRAATKRSDAVAPFVGTDGSGHVIPGAVVPFGTVAPSPDNTDRGWGSSGSNQYRAPRIVGFSDTRISGAGVPEVGDVLQQPAAGARWTREHGDLSTG
jgi:putative alpha-1,2-mannosidase